MIQLYAKTQELPYNFYKGNINMVAYYEVNI